MPENNNQNEQHGQAVPVQGQANAENKVATNSMQQNLYGGSAAKNDKPTAGKPQGAKKGDTTPDTPPKSKRNDEKTPVERSIIGKDNEKIRDFINECPAMMLDSIRVVLHLAANNGSEDGIAAMDMRIFNAI